MRLMSWLILGVLALALSGCGMANSYATLANAAGSSARDTVRGLR